MLEGLESRQLGTLDAETELIGRIAIGPGAQISRSLIVGPVIMWNAT